jgi:hypothetical protein
VRKIALENPDKDRIIVYMLKLMLVTDAAMCYFSPVFLQQGKVDVDTFRLS